MIVLTIDKLPKEVRALVYPYKRSLIVLLNHALTEQEEKQFIEEKLKTIKTVKAQCQIVY